MLATIDHPPFIETMGIAPPSLKKNILLSSVIDNVWYLKFWEQNRLTLTLSLKFVVHSLHLYKISLPTYPSFNTLNS